MEESLKSLSLDYLNMLINGQAFSDVAFSVEGRLVHAHRCILAARSLFFRNFFCGPDQPPVRIHAGLHSPSSSPRSAGSSASSSVVIPINSVSYEVFLLLLQFLYSGQVSVVPQKYETRPNCGERGCWHSHCSAAVDLALDTLVAARSFGVEQLAVLTQNQLLSMVEKASIKDVMKVLIASRKQDMLWTTCSHLVAKSGLPPEVLSKHLPIEELRLKSSFSRRSSSSFLGHHHHRHHHQLDVGPSSADIGDHHKIRRMRRALDSSDVELVKLMVIGVGLNLDDALALHYAVENCSREVVKALLELGVADVNYPAGPAGKTPLHVAAEMVCPDMVTVLLDHHADSNVQTVDGVTPLDILRTLTSDFLFKGAVPGLSHIEPNKLRLCLELVQSAAKQAPALPRARAVGAETGESTKKQLVSMVEKASIEDVMGEGLNLDDAHKIRRMRRALDSSDVALVKLMVMGEGFNLDDALALHYAVENCSREVVKALLELGVADVNYPAGPAGKTPLHVAAEMVCLDMVAVLLDHHADPNVQTVDGVTPVDILRTLTSDFLFKGAVPGLSHIEPNKLRLCLELVQSAAMVMSREEANSTVVSGGGGGSASNAHPGGMIYPQESSICNSNSTSSSMVNLSLDSRMVYLNLGMAAQLDGSSSRSQGGGGIGLSSMYSSHDFP